MKLEHYLRCFWGSLLGSYPFWAAPIPAQAQIASDHSMSVPTQVIRSSDNLFEIMEGTQAGNNLFHSFSEFSVPKENIARFVNDNPAIQNVISRVTGSSVSRILGTIQAGGSAPNFNLFLLNPQGIIFGSHASLDLNGSFVATTANAIQFGDRVFFSASSVNDPSLLSVQPSAFFFNQVRAKAIRYQASQQPAIGLNVPSDQSLLLLGGDVTINGGILTAPNGHIELGGLAEPGTVALKMEGSNLSLSFPDNLARADVLLTRGAIVDVKDRGRGSIVINGRNIKITGASELSSGISPGLEASDSKAGEITLQATEAVVIDGSTIGSLVGSGDQAAIGPSGDISINAGSLQLLNGGYLYTISNGQGDAGDININIRDRITLKGRSPDSDSLSSEIANRVSTLGEGKGGNITIKARSLSLADGAIIGTATLGKGNAGNIILQIDDFVSLENTTHDTTQIRTAVDPGAIGNGGTIRLQARSLSLTGGSQLIASVVRSDEILPGGQGKGGDIIVHASDAVNIEGVGLDGYSSGIFANTETGALGDAGDITINTQALRLANGGIINAQTNNAANGGNIRINTQSLEALSGGQLITNSVSSGNAGSIMVNATNRVTLSGSDPTFMDRKAQFGSAVVGNTEAASGLFARSSDRGSAGNLTIQTPQLTLQDGAQVSAASVSSQGGNINLQGLDTLVVDHSNISASTQKGRAGNLTINATQSVRLKGDGGLSVGAIADGIAGNLTVETDQMTIAQGAKVTVSSPQGQAGNLKITARSLTLDQGAITAETGKSGVDSGANITLQLADLLRLENESLISATATGNANGGNIDIDTLLLTVFPPSGSYGSDIIAKAERGNGGSIRINAQGIFGIAERPAILGDQSNDIDASSEFGASGQVQINSTLDPNRGVIQLPETVVDPNDLIAQNPCRRGTQSQFTRTGRGGLPPSPKEDLSSLATQVGLVEPAPIAVQEQGNRLGQVQPTTAIASAIVPTQGWIWNAQGEVVLVAYDPTVIGSQRLQATPEGCPVQ